MQYMKVISCALILGLIFLFGCETDDPFGPAPERERTFMHFLNAYSDLSGVDIRLTSFEEKRVVADGVTFKKGWPISGYASLLTTPDPDSVNGKGAITVEFLDTGSKESVVPARTLKLAADVHSTICLIDSFGKPLIVKTVDNFIDPAPGKALVRFMNLDYKTLSVTLYSSDDSVRIPRLNFLNYSTFNETEPGEKDFIFFNDFTGNVLGTIQNVDLKARKAYSFFLTNKDGTPSVGYEILD